MRHVTLPVEHEAPLFYSETTIDCSILYFSILAIQYRVFSWQCVASMALSPNHLARQGAKLQHLPRLMAHMCGARRPLQAGKWVPGRPYCAAASTDAASDQQPMQLEQAFQELPAAQFNRERVRVVDVFGKLAFNPVIRSINSKATGQTFQVTEVPVDAVMPGQGPNNETQRVHLEFWGDAATSVSQQLKRGDWVQVHGQIFQDKWADKTTQQPRVRIKVKVTSINKVTGVPENL